MANAALDDHRPIECFAIECQQHFMVGHRLPERGEHGGLLSVVPGEQKLNRWLTIDLTEQPDKEQGGSGQTARFEVQADSTIRERTDQCRKLRRQNERWFNRMFGGSQLYLQEFLASANEFGAV